MKTSTQRFMTRGLRSMLTGGCTAALLLASALSGRALAEPAQAVQVRATTEWCFTIVGVTICVPKDPK
jgi:uncharacterized membrane protein